ncbi:hypothetical protein GCM10017576_06030 [Microbacterium barkeri]|uniref:Uncharacterized protein n=1 Tax=Microbacterium barkeri TaxID=33917 RepID=A0A9W6LV78_9MICO|nr:hypothetical protein GCM10017576_06030 [Microbacterium barkeri]
MPLGEALEEREAVGEVVIRRVVAHTRPACDLTEAQRRRTALRQERFRRLEQRGTEVAMVVPADGC